MIKPTKEKLAESREWRAQMVVAYRRNRLIKQQIKQLEKIPNWSWERPNMKERLLELAKSGADKPYWKNKEGKALAIYNALSSYTSAPHVSYDADFDKEIRALRPDWFVKPADTKKEELFELARSGAARPHYKTRPGKNLVRYLQYDPAFTEKLHTIRPDWRKSHKTETTKKTLRKLAIDGAPIPVYGTPFRIFLRKTKDQKFIEELKKLAPQWFDNYRVINKKKRLLKLAENGASRPNQKKHLLGPALCSYTCFKSNCFDPIFNKKIRSLRPDWFQVA